MSNGHCGSSLAWLDLILGYCIIPGNHNSKKGLATRDYYGSSYLTTAYLAPVYIYT